MKPPSKYASKPPDKNGIVAYTPEENSTWETLMARQMPIVKNYACKEFLTGLDILAFPKDKIPQLPNVNKKLQQATGWSVEPVAALINFDKFFNLLANKKFPAATFIRTPEELDYLQEPDVFHELFGHCPMLTEPTYANFMQEYGRLGQNATAEDQVMLARLYWFTVEFGLIKTEHGLKVYGGGILSSIEETSYAIDSHIPIRKTFDLLEIFRTPYRIDILQTIYYVINNYETLYEVTQQDLFNIIHEARRLGMFEPTYPI